MIFYAFIATGLVLAGVLLILDTLAKKRASPPKEEDGHTISEARGKSEVHVVNNRYRIRVSDGGYVRCKINGKIVELRSKPGEGPKEIIVE